jgi:hypothetical protein
VPGRGRSAIMAAMRRHGARSNTTNPGHHPTMERARDVTPHNWAAANAARALSGVWYVIYQMRIASKNHGNTWRQFVTSSRRGDWQHRRHIHVARYADGTRSAARGFGWTAEKGAELVVNPQLRRYSGGERVLNNAETRKELGGLGARPISVTNNFPVTMDPAAAYAAAGGLTVARLQATGDF